MVSSSDCPCSSGASASSSSSTTIISRLLSDSGFAIPKTGTFNSKMDGLASERSAVSSCTTASNDMPFVSRPLTATSTEKRQSSACCAAAVSLCTRLIETADACFCHLPPGLRANTKVSALFWMVSNKPVCGCKQGGMTARRGSPLFPLYSHRAGDAESAREWLPVCDELDCFAGVCNIFIIITAFIA